MRIICKYFYDLTSGWGHLNTGQQEEKSSVIQLSYQNLHRTHRCIFTFSYLLIIIVKLYLQSTFFRKRKNTEQYRTGHLGKKTAMEITSNQNCRQSVTLDDGGVSSFNPIMVVWRVKEATGREEVRARRAGASGLGQFTVDPGRFHAEGQE